MGQLFSCPKEILPILLYGESGIELDNACVLPALYSESCEDWAGATYKRRELHLCGEYLANVRQP